MRSRHITTGRGKRESKFHTFFLSFLALLLVVGLVVLLRPLGSRALKKEHAPKETSQQKVEAKPTPPVTTAYKSNDASWLVTIPAQNHLIEGYASADSVAQGSHIGFYISCGTNSIFRTEVFRMGWYSGSGAQEIEAIPGTACEKQRAVSPDPWTGLINLNWKPSLNLSVGRDWPQGFYLARVTSYQGYQSYIPFVVRSPTAQNKILLIHATATDEAYNTWGGNSLYQGSTPKLHIQRAVKASLNRPFVENNGAGDFLNWEYFMVRFLERNGYQADYATDLDIDRDPSLLLKYKTVIITGHDEYWTSRMLDGYKNAVKKGVNLAIFAANTAYRPARYEVSPSNGQKYRVITCYKNGDLDPDKKKSEITPYSWRSRPLHMPESSVTGEEYNGETKTSASLVVYNGSNWVFTGTNLKRGDVFPSLVGYEYDEYLSTDPTPNKLDPSVIFKSRVIDLTNNKPDYSDSVYYELPDGGQVFNAGTIQWSWGLDPQLKTYNHNLEIITANILNRFSP